MLNFSIVLIARNEEKTLPRLLKSLEEFKKGGGEVCLLDTGSTDNTVSVAKNWGCKVEEVGNEYLTVLDESYAERINQRFSDDEGEIVKEGQKSFHFADARNRAAKIASNDMISMPDCDEIFTKLDIDATQEYVKNNDQLEFNFVFAHDSKGNETIKFIQCKMYDRTKLKWTGRIHEVLTNFSGEKIRRSIMPEDKFKIEHYQNETTNRNQYLVGLAIDCFENQDKDRNSHYFARELMYRGFYKSAIREFKRHLTIGTWKAERGQSMIFIGECLMKLGQEQEALEWYHKSYLECADRREPLIRLGKYFFDKKDWKRCIFYLEGSLRIKYSGFYADNMAHYKDYPYSMLYVACWWDGNKEKAKYYFNKAVELNPDNPVYKKEAKFFKEETMNYNENNIDGYMSLRELNFLHDKAKEMKSVLEVGSWKGRSTHALLTGCKGEVTAVDHFQGSADILDSTNKRAKVEDIYGEFLKNVGSFKNLKIEKMSSERASEKLKDEKFEMIFIDGEHTYEAVKKDIELWKGKCTKFLCGHDYTTSWPGVMKAVDETLGKPDGIVASIWYKEIKADDVSKTTGVAEAFIDLATRMLEENKNFSFIKRGDGEDACMNDEKGANCDGDEYTPELANALRDAYDFLWGRADCYVPKFHNQDFYNSLLHREDSDLAKVSKFYQDIASSNRKKIYVGPEKLKIVKEILNADIHITVPEKNTFRYFDNLVLDLKLAIEDNCIILFSCGLTAKPLIAECLKHNSNITCLDIGSSFDPIIKNTRTGQVDQKTLKDLYGVDLPKVSILIPTLKRPEGLKKCLDSIDKLNYPKNRLEVLVEEDEPRIGVAKRLNKLFAQSTGDLVVYGSNDIEFTPDSIRNAVKYIKENDLVSFNTGEVLPDEGNICEHFIIKRDVVNKILKGKIFSEKFNHLAVDNLLWATIKKFGKVVRADNAIVKHYHFSNNNAKFDDVYKLGWEDVDNDRKILKEELDKLNEK